MSTAFQPHSPLVFNLIMASLLQPLHGFILNLLPPLVSQLFVGPCYRMPCSALAKKSLRIHEPELTPGLGSENGYTFIFHARNGKET